MSQLSTWDRVEETAAHIRTRCLLLPETAIVLGSGLGDFADTLLDAIATPYSDLPHWPPSRVIGHAGRLVIGTVAGRRIAVLSGRVHFYEGYDLASVVFGTRVMGRLGVRRLILTNAAGGINTAFAEGALMIIDDHINMMGGNPLIGANDDRFGPRFPDMTDVYSKSLRDVADKAARARGVAVSYLRRRAGAELRNAGGDPLLSPDWRRRDGMSTVPEAVAARHMGLEVLGISCISNAAAGILPNPIVHDEVIATMHRIRSSFVALLEGIIERI